MIKCEPTPFRCETKTHITFLTEGGGGCCIDFADFTEAMLFPLYGPVSNFSISSNYSSLLVEMGSE